MTIKTELDAIKAQRDANIDQVLDIFLSTTAIQGIQEYLAYRLADGHMDGRIHIEKDGDPWHLSSGYATLSGELASDNGRSARGLTIKNEIADLYFNAPYLEYVQFVQYVHDFASNLIAEELTIQITIGNEMADIVITWS